MLLTQLFFQEQTGSFDSVFSNAGNSSSTPVLGFIYAPPNRWAFHEKNLCGQAETERSLPQCQMLRNAPRRICPNLAPRRDSRAVATGSQGFNRHSHMTTSTDGDIEMAVEVAALT